MWKQHCNKTCYKETIINRILFTICSISGFRVDRVRGLQPMPDHLKSAPAKHTQGVLGSHGICK